MVYLTQKEMFTNLERAEPIIRVEANEPAEAPVVNREVDRRAVVMPVKRAVAMPRMAIPAVEAEPEDEIDDLTDGQKENRFWDIIKRFNWRNATDQRMNFGATERTFNNFSKLDKDVFRELYQAKYNQMREVMRDAIAAAGADEKQVVSHLIAMGRETYTTVIDSPMLGDFFMNSGECQLFPTPNAL
jgi:hypothetical protein